MTNEQGQELVRVQREIDVEYLFNKFTPVGPEVLSKGTLLVGLVPKDLLEKYVAVLHQADVLDIEISNAFIRESASANH